MSVRTIPASELRPDMTLLRDGQNHIVGAALYDGAAIVVAVETVTGNMGHKVFIFLPDEPVRVLEAS